MTTESHTRSNGNVEVNSYDEKGLTRTVRQADEDVVTLTVAADGSYKRVVRGPDGKVKDRTTGVQEPVTAPTPPVAAAPTATGSVDPAVVAPGAEATTTTETSGTPATTATASDFTTIAPVSPPAGTSGGQVPGTVAPPTIQVPTDPPASGPTTAPATDATGVATTGAVPATTVPATATSWSSVSNDVVHDYTYDPASGVTTERHRRDEAVVTNVYAGGELDRTVKKDNGDTVTTTVDAAGKTKKVVRDKDGKLKDRDVSVGTPVTAPVAPVSAAPAGTDTTPIGWTQANANGVPVDYTHDPVSNSTVAEYVRPDGGTVVQTVNGNGSWHQTTAYKKNDKVVETFGNADGSASKVVTKAGETVSEKDIAGGTRVAATVTPEQLAQTGETVFVNGSGEKVEHEVLVGQDATQSSVTTDGTQVEKTVTLDGNQFTVKQVGGDRTGLTRNIQVDADGKRTVWVLDNGNGEVLRKTVTQGAVPQQLTVPDQAQTPPTVTTTETPLGEQTTTRWSDGTTLVEQPTASGDRIETVLPTGLTTSQRVDTDGTVVTVQKDAAGGAELSTRSTEGNGVVQDLPAQLSEVDVEAVPVVDTTEKFDSVKATTAANGTARVRLGWDGWDGKVTVAPDGSTTWIQQAGEAPIEERGKQIQQRKVDAAEQTAAADGTEVVVPDETEWAGWEQQRRTDADGRLVSADDDLRGTANDRTRQRYELTPDGTQTSVVRTDDAVADQRRTFVDRADKSSTMKGAYDPIDNPDKFTGRLDIAPNGIDLTSRLELQEDETGLTRVDGARRLVTAADGSTSVEGELVYRRDGDQQYTDADLARVGKDLRDVLGDGGLSASEKREKASQLLADNGLHVSEENAGRTDKGFVGWLGRTAGENSRNKALAKDVTAIPLDFRSVVLDQTDAFPTQDPDAPHRGEDEIVQGIPVYRTPEGEPVLLPGWTDQLRIDESYLDQLPAVQAQRQQAEQAGSTEDSDDEDSSGSSLGAIGTQVATKVAGKVLSEVVGDVPVVGTAAGSIASGLIVEGTVDPKDVGAAVGTELLRRGVSDVAYRTAFDQIARTGADMTSRVVLNQVANTALAASTAIVGIATPIIQTAVGIDVDASTGPATILGTTGAAVGAAFGPLGSAAGYVIGSTLGNVFQSALAGPPDSAADNLEQGLDATEYSAQNPGATLAEQVFRDQHDPAAPVHEYTDQQYLGQATFDLRPGVTDQNQALWAASSPAKLTRESDDGRYYQRAAAVLRATGDTTSAAFAGQLSRVADDVAKHGNEDGWKAEQVATALAVVEGSGGGMGKARAQAVLQTLGPDRLAELKEQSTGRTGGGSDGSQPDEQALADYAALDKQFVRVVDDGKEGRDRGADSSVTGTALARSTFPKTGQLMTSFAYDLVNEAGPDRMDQINADARVVGDGYDEQFGNYLARNVISPDGGQPTQLRAEDTQRDRAAIDAVQQVNAELVRSGQKPLTTEQARTVINDAAIGYQHFQDDKMAPPEVNDIAGDGRSDLGQQIVVGLANAGGDFALDNLASAITGRGSTPAPDPSTADGAQEVGTVPSSTVPELEGSTGGDGLFTTVTPDQASGVTVGSVASSGTVPTAGTGSGPVDADGNAVVPTGAQSGTTTVGTGNGGDGLVAQLTEPNPQPRPTPTPPEQVRPGGPMVNEAAENLLLDAIPLEPRRDTTDPLPGTGGTTYPGNGANRAGIWRTAPDGTLYLTPFQNEGERSGDRSELPAGVRAGNVVEPADARFDTPASGTGDGGSGVTDGAGTVVVPADAPFGTTTLDLDAIPPVPQRDTTNPPPGLGSRPGDVVLPSGNVVTDDGIWRRNTQDGTYRLAPFRAGIGAGNGAGNVVPVDGRSGTTTLRTSTDSGLTDGAGNLAAGQGVPAIPGSGDELTGRSGDRPVFGMVQLPELSDNQNGRAAAPGGSSVPDATGSGGATDDRRDQLVLLNAGGPGGGAGTGGSGPTGGNGLDVRTTVPFGIQPEGSLTDGVFAISPQGNEGGQRQQQVDSLRRQARQAADEGRFSDSRELYDGASRLEQEDQPTTSPDSEPSEQQTSGQQAGEQQAGEQQSSPGFATEAAGAQVNLPSTGEDPLAAARLRLDQAQQLSNDSTAKSFGLTTLTGLAGAGIAAFLSWYGLYNQVPQNARLNDELQRTASDTIAQIQNGPHAETLVPGTSMTAGQYIEAQRAANADPADTLKRLQSDPPSFAQMLETAPERNAEDLAQTRNDVGNLDDALARQRQLNTLEAARVKQRLELVQGDLGRTTRSLGRDDASLRRAQASLELAEGSLTRDLTQADTDAVGSWVTDVSASSQNALDPTQVVDGMKAGGLPLPYFDRVTLQDRDPEQVWTETQALQQRIRAQHPNARLPELKREDVIRAAQDYYERRGRDGRTDTGPGSPSPTVTPLPGSPSPQSSVPREQSGSTEISAAGSDNSDLVVDPESGALVPAFMLGMVGRRPGNRGRDEQGRQAGDASQQPQTGGTPPDGEDDPNQTVSQQAAALDEEARQTNRRTTVNSRMAWLTAGITTASVIANGITFGLNQNLKGNLNTLLDNNAQPVLTQIQSDGSASRIPLEPGGTPAGEYIQQQLEMGKSPYEIEQAIRLSSNFERIVPQQDPQARQQTLELRARSNRLQAELVAEQVRSQEISQADLQIRQATRIALIANQAEKLGQEAAALQQRSLDASRQADQTSQRTQAGGNVETWNQTIVEKYQGDAGWQPETLNGARIPYFDRAPTRALTPDESATLTVELHRTTPNPAFRGMTEDQIRAAVRERVNNFYDQYPTFRTQGRVEAPGSPAPSGQSPASTPAVPSGSPAPSGQSPASTPALPPRRLPVDAPGSPVPSGQSPAPTPTVPPGRLPGGTSDPQGSSEEQPQSQLPGSGGTAPEVALVPDGQTGNRGSEGGVTIGPDLPERPTLDEMKDRTFPGGRPDQAAPGLDLPDHTGQPRDPEADEIARQGSTFVFPNPQPQRPETETFPDRSPDLNSDGRGQRLVFPDFDVPDSRLPDRKDDSTQGAGEPQPQVAVTTQPGSTRVNGTGQPQTLASTQPLLGGGGANTTPGRIQYFQNADGAGGSAVITPAWTQLPNGTKIAQIPNLGASEGYNPAGNVVSVQRLDNPDARVTAQTPLSTVTVRTSRQTVPLAGGGAVIREPVPGNPTREYYTVRPSQQVNEVLNADGSRTRTITYSAEVPEGRRLSIPGGERFEVDAGASTHASTMNVTQYIPAPVRQSTADGASVGSGVPAGNPGEYQPRGTTAADAYREAPQGAPAQARYGSVRSDMEPSQAAEPATDPADQVPQGTFDPIDALGRVVGPVIEGAGALNRILSGGTP